MMIFVHKMPFLLVGLASVLMSSDDTMLSQKSAADFPLTADPESPQWRDAPRVKAAKDRWGKALPEASTEIRSRWTDRHLYFLFISPYQELYLRPEPSVEKETWGLWEWDVVEVFIGDDFDDIGRYKEFEVSPRGEWVDLEVDRSRKGKEVDWLWNSGLKNKTQIDEKRKVWYCEMQIPWSAIDRRTPKAGNELRLNLYRIEGAPPNRKYITWRPVNSPSFHTPQAFGRLRLIEEVSAVQVRP
jgi:hypothetical protein